MKEILNKIGHNFNVLILIMFSYYAIVIYFLIGVEAYFVFSLSLLTVLILMKFLGERKKKINK